MCEEYQGWTNRETWCLALYVNNDQGMYESARELVNDSFTGAIEQGEERFEAICQARDAFESWVEDCLTIDGHRIAFGDDMPYSSAKIAEDIGSFYRIDYKEVTESLLEDALTEFDAGIEAVK